MSAGEVIHTSTTGGQKAGNNVRMSLVPIRELLQVAELYGTGAAKYDDHNWMKGYEWSKSYDALWRHMGEFWDGNEIDDGEGGTGLPHLTCAAFHVFSLLYFSKHHRDLDDRPNTVMAQEEWATAPPNAEDPLAEYLRSLDLEVRASTWFPPQ